MPNGETTKAGITTAAKLDPTKNANGQNVFDTLSSKINEGLEDLSAIVIITARAKMGTEITLNPTTGKVQPVKEIIANLAALTSIGLDGDIVELVPDENIDAQKRAELMQRHDHNVEKGVTNWNNFINGVIKIVRIAADLSGRPLPNSFDDAGKIVTIPS
jgi:hypothetical protein